MAVEMEELYRSPAIAGISPATSIQDESLIRHEPNFPSGGEAVAGIVLMHLNNWVILAAALLVLLVIARYMQHHETPAICVDNPTAPVCHR
jgi:hypothetical protein